jgi:flagellar biosynthesis/type III secretory pathway protein FliH
MSKGRRLVKRTASCVTCGKTFHPWHREQRACSKPCRQYRFKADDLARRAEQIKQHTEKGANASRRAASIRWGALAADMTPAQIARAMYARGYKAAYQTGWNRGRQQGYEAGYEACMVEHGLTMEVD